MKTKWVLISIITVFIAVCALSTTAVAGTLDEIKDRGYLLCGVGDQSPGFGYAKQADDGDGDYDLVDMDGYDAYVYNGGNGEYNLEGMDVDFHKALAAAVFGDATKIIFIVTETTDDDPRRPERFRALKEGIIDVLIRTSTWTLERDTIKMANFTNVSYYDGQGFAVYTDPDSSTEGISLEELQGSNFTIGVVGGTTTDTNLQNWYNGPVDNSFTKTSEMLEAYENGLIDGITSDLGSLPGKLIHSQRGYELVAGVISKEPLGPSVRHGDDQWFDIVKWVVNATIIAEEEGLTKDNVESFKNNKSKKVSTQIKRLVGTEGNRGAMLGLDRYCFYNVIKAVGNYGEIFDRNVKPYGVSRGLNKNYKDDEGILYSPPM